MKKYLLSTTAILLMVPSVAQAADQDPAARLSSPAPARPACARADSAAPIQMIGKEAFQSVGQQDLTQVLAQSLPSLNFQSFGGDTANLTLSAALRGISPNDTLVLINGKRRHTTANLSVLGGSPYSGSATTDLFIPTNAIGHVEAAGRRRRSVRFRRHRGRGEHPAQEQRPRRRFTTGGSNYENGGATAATAVNLGFKLGERASSTSPANTSSTITPSTAAMTVASSIPMARSSPGQSSVVTNRLQSNSKYPNVNTINGDARYAFNFTFNAGYDIGSDAQAYAFRHLWQPRFARL
jgi:iron complex outermembrane receptor protein